MQRIHRPMRYEEMHPFLDSNGRFTGELVIDLRDIVACEGPGGFQELCEQRAFVYGNLESFSYQLVGHRTPTNEKDKGAVIVEIKGEYIGFISKG